MGSLPDGQPASNNSRDIKQKVIIVAVLTAVIALAGSLCYV